MKEGNSRILIVDDDVSIQEMLSCALESFGKVDCVFNAAEARRKFCLQEYDIVLLDYKLPESDGLTLLGEFKALQPQTEIIVITHTRDIKLAVQSIKAGAFDYINKDFNLEDLKALILRVIEKLKSNRELLFLRSEIERLTDQEFILGISERMQTIKAVLDRCAATSATVLLEGESGTGKELIARYIHRRSPRVGKPFVAVNMGSIPDNLVESTLFGHEKGAFTGAHKTTVGKYELADGGTIFCDEIADLKLELQAKLLRVMQENEIEKVGGQKPIQIDVRIIAATNRNLKALVEAGKFREDLYYRLNVIPIFLPPLRERVEDIPLFMDLFLKRYNRKYGRNLKCSPQALNLISHYDWPGNIRELENLVARLVAIHHAEEILPEDIPLDFHIPEVFQVLGAGEETDPLRAATDAFERSFILRVMEKENWHQGQTAHRLGIHRKTLEYKLKRLKLNTIIEKRQRSTQSG